MRRARRCSLLAIALALVLAVGASSAEAARQPQVAVSPDGTAHLSWLEGLLAERAWTPAGALTDTQALSNVRSQVHEHDVAADASGAAYHVWTRQRPGVVVVEGRRRGADGSLGPILALSSAVNSTAWAHVAVDPDGDAVFVWCRQTGTDDFIQARRLSATGVLGPSLTLTPPGYQARRPEVAMDATGNALVVWDRHATSNPEGNDSIVQARRIKPDGTLGATQTLSPPAPIIESAQVAMDGDGNALVGWILPGFDNGSGMTGDFPQVRRRSASGTLGGIQDVAPATASPARSLRLAMSPSGSAMITWARFVDSYQEVQARHRRPGGGFGSVLTLSQLGGFRDSGAQQVAMDADGDALVVWERHSPGSGDPEKASTIHARRRSSAGVVGPIETVAAATGVEHTGTVLGMAPDGAATILYETGPGPADPRDVHGRRRQPSGGYTAAKWVSGP